jgi:hypothetical protein
MESSVHDSGRVTSGKQSHPQPLLPEGKPRVEFETCPIQLFYGTLMDLLTKLGFVFLMITFALYIFGVLFNFVPRETLPQYWGQPLPRYLELTHVPTGWAWLRELHHGDFLNLLPIAFLAGITIICTFTIAVRFFRNRESFQGLIAALEIAVLLLAASGILKVGGQ